MTLKLLVENLIGVLTEEIQLHKQLLELSVSKKGILIKNNLNELEKMTLQEGQLLQDVKKLEEKREFVTGKIAKVLNITKQEAKLDRIAQESEGELKQKVLDVKKDLGSVVRELSRYNALNKKLIETHLDYTRFSVALMMNGRALPETTYNNSGYMDEVSKPLIGLMDQEA